MTKKLDTTSIMSELEGSAFFPLKQTPAAKEQQVNKPTNTQASKPDQQLVSGQAKKKTHPRTANPSHRTARPYVRRTFDLFEDQLAYLTRASLEERLAGGEGSMNAMVREAIDAFIASRKS